jgi:hypothetical protein
MSSEESLDASKKLLVSVPVLEGRILMLAGR